MRDSAACCVICPSINICLNALLNFVEAVLPNFRPNFLGTQLSQRSQALQASAIISGQGRQGFGLFFQSGVHLAIILPGALMAS